MAPLGLSSCAPAKSSAARPGPVVRFRDIAAEAGVDFRHVNGASPQKYFPETMGAGVAVLDYDNDGWLDLLFVNGRPLAERRDPVPTLRLYRNEGVLPLRFRDVSRETGLAVSLYGMGAAVGDYDNDGWRDLYVSAVLGPGRLFRNRSGRFQDVTEAAGVGNRGKWGAGCAWLDYDRDGRLDLYVASYVRYRSLADDLPCEVRPGRRSYCVPAPYEGVSGTLYRNTGARFEDVTKTAGLHDPLQKALGVTAADVNDDGLPDLLVANDTVPNRLFLNRQGRFEDGAMLAGIAFGPNGTPRAGMGIDLTEGLPGAAAAVAVTNFMGESIGLYTAPASSQVLFTDRSRDLGVAGPSAPFLGFGIRFLDLDNDGLQDLCAVNGHVRDDVAELEPGQSYAQRALLFYHRGERFEEIGAAAGATAVPAVRRGLASGDLDNDGRVDLVVTRNGGPAEVWRNETEPAGHWLAVCLRSRRSGREGLGARVRVRAGGRELAQAVVSGGSYLSESDHCAHFGLGEASSIDGITVRWPSGVEQEFPGGPADRRLTLEEAVP